VRCHMGPPTEPPTQAQRTNEREVTELCRTRARLKPAVGFSLGRMTTDPRSPQSRPRCGSPPSSHERRASDSGLHGSRNGVGQFLRAGPQVSQEFDDDGCWSVVFRI
jgi:hypothetical protein